MMDVLALSETVLCGNPGPKHRQNKQQTHHLILHPLQLSHQIANHLLCFNFFLTTNSFKPIFSFVYMERLG